MATLPKIAPVPSNAPQFAHEFTKRMRARKDVTKQPSVRQTQSIPMLLSARYFRNGKLTLEDFLESAIYTTFPPDQAIAREVAEDILLGREKEEPKSGVPNNDAVIAASKSDALAAVMNQIRREQELAKVIKKEKVEAGYSYLLELRKKEDQSLYEAAKDYLSDGEIVLRGITTDDELKETAGAELKERFGGLSSQDIQNSQVLECLDDVCESPNAAEQIAAGSLRGDSDTEEKFAELCKRDATTAARALRHMEELGTLTEEQQKSFDKQLQDALNDLSEAADYASELGRVPDNIDELVKDAAQRFSLSDAAALAKKIKEATGTDLMDDLLEQYDEQYESGAGENVDLQQLSENPRSNEHWDNLVKKEVESMLESADSRSSPSDFLRSYWKSSRFA